MRKDKMIKRSKKIVAVALSLAMMIPVAFSQAVVTNAAASGSSTTTSTTAQKSIKDVLSVELDKSSSTTFSRNETVVLILKAKEKINAAAIAGTVSFQDANGDNLAKAFSMNKVIASGWYAGYDTDTLSFNLTVSSAVDIPAQTEIARIELKVLKEIDTATALISFNKVDIRDSNNNDVKVESDADKNNISCALSSSLTGARGVDLSIESAIKQPIYSFSNASSTTLRTFSVPVKITKNTGFNAMTIQFQYDSSKMTYKGYELSPKALMYLNCITEFQGVTTGSSGTTSGYVSLSFAGTDDNKVTGDFLTLTFDVNSSARAKDTATITPVVTEIQNASETANLKTTVNTCTVTFEEGYARGDVNQDHKISLLDVTYALQFYNNVRTLTTEQQALADVNGDGKVTLVDVLMLLKKCNGENITFA